MPEKPEKKVKTSKPPVNSREKKSQVAVSNSNNIKSKDKPAQSLRSGKKISTQLTKDSNSQLTQVPRAAKSVSGESQFKSVRKIKDSAEKNIKNNEDGSDGFHQPSLFSTNNSTTISNSSCEHLMEDRENLNNNLTLDLKMQNNSNFEPAIEEQELVKEVDSHPEITETLEFSDEEMISQSKAVSVNNVSIRISQSLHKKLIHKAQSEGISLNELISELLAEGLVLRAWEIMERKAAMRSGSGASQNFAGRQSGRNGYRNQGSNNFNRRQNNNYNSNLPASGRRNNNYQSILEDNANFLEYVRSQEKKQR